MTRNRIIVPREPESKQAPLFSTTLVQREFLRVLKQKSAWDTQIKLAQLRASILDDEEGESDADTVRR